MKLNSLLICEPVQSVALILAKQCASFARHRILVRNENQLFNAMQKHHCEMAIVSLETPSIDLLLKTKQLREQHQQSLWVATFRELSTSQLKNILDTGFQALFPQPVPPEVLQDLVSARFNLPFRRHPRYNIHCELWRTDGVLTGHSINLSEGGIYFQSYHPISPHSSILLDIVLPQTQQRLRLRCSVLEVTGHLPQNVCVRAEFSHQRSNACRQLAQYLLQYHLPC